MADVGAWTAAATACAAAIGTVITAARQPADVATLRAEVKAAREEAAPAIEKAVAAVVALIDPKLRADLNSVVRRVVALEEWRKTAREQRTDSGRTAVTSGPDLSAYRDAEHERRIVALEARTERTEATLAEARVTLGNVLGKLEAYLSRKAG